jgi:23S rRNA pseudouridine955/2504/2580 synthase
MKVSYLIIDENHHGQRVDNFLLGHFKKVPRSVIYRILRKGEVRVNKKRVDPTYRLNQGDEIRIPPVKQNFTEQDIKVNPNIASVLEKSILYEDDSILVLNKPAGLPVHGGSGNPAGLIELFRVMRPDYKFLELVHRLDRDTSGCLLLAKKSSVLKQLHQMLREHTIRKTYHALVIGVWPKAVNRVDGALEKNTLKSGERRVRVSDEGKPSVTTFQILKIYDGLTLIAAFPETGRTHQIRVHTKETGHPILGDDKYGNFEMNEKLAKAYHMHRMCLHAAKLNFIHPATQKEIVVEAPYDKSMQLLIERLK